MHVFLIKLPEKPCTFIFKNQYNNLYINNLSVFQQTLNKIYKYQQNRLLLQTI